MGYEILKDNYQKLYIESAKAEKYIETDFETSIEKVNKILEVLCKELYQKHYNEELDYVEIINVLYDNGYLSSEDKNALHDIRKKRNSIIHEGNEATEGFAKWAYKAGENISYNIINCIKRTVDIAHKSNRQNQVTPTKQVQHQQKNSQPYLYKKKSRKSIPLIASIIIILVVCFSIGALAVNNYMNAGCIIEENVLTAYRGTEKSVTVPDNIEVVGKYAFSGNKSIETIVLPNSITTIEMSAFEDCVNLKSINLPNGLTTIETSAFSGCYNVKELNLPNTLTSIGNAAFSRCSSISSIIIPEGVEKIETSTFSGCESLTSIILPSSLKHLGSHAFRECTSLRKIFIPEGITNFPEALFYGCTNLQTVNVPVSVTKIKRLAFMNCEPDIYCVIGSYADQYYTQNGIKHISVDSFDDAQLTSDFIIDGGKLIKYTGAGGDVVIPENVTIIGEYVFNENNTIDTVSFAGNIQEIENCAFRLCSLKQINLPESLKYIGEQAFIKCESLEEITIPGNVEYIGPYAFQESGISSLTVCEGVETIGSKAFTSCPSLNKIELPDTLHTVEDHAFYNDELAYVYIPSSVTSIGSYAFSGCLVDYDQGSYAQMYFE